MTNTTHPPIGTLNSQQSLAQKAEGAYGLAIACGQIDTRKPARTIKQVLEAKLSEAEGRVEQYRRLLQRLEKMPAGELTLEEMHEIGYRL